MRQTILKFSYLLFFCAPLFLTSCGDDDEVPPVDPLNIVETALADDQFSTLVEALTKAELVATLEGDGPFTVFAPNNAAFEAAGIVVADVEKEALTDILLYHVFGDKLLSSEISADQQTYAGMAATNSPGGKNISLLIEKDDNGVTLNGSTKVSTADVDATNGVIHIIDNVLLPPNLVQAAQANSNFTSLVDALVAAPGDLPTVLTSDDFTVFAPVNSAFAEIQETVDALTSEQLANVLTYHVVGGQVRSEDLSEGAVTTVNTQAITIGIDGAAVSVTDQGGGVADVVLADVQTTNGVIHVLNKVLIPSL